MVSKDIKTAKSVQEVWNLGFDTEFNLPVVEMVGYDGNDMQRLTSDAVATKITVSGDDTYIGIAPPGTAQATAKWQCKKISVSGSDTTITWADGDSEFDNVATDLTSLSYS